MQHFTLFELLKILILGIRDYGLGKNPIALLNIK